MTILTTIIGIVFIIAGLIYGLLLYIVEMGYMSDRENPISEWGFVEYLHIVIIPLVLIVVGVILIK